MTDANTTDATRKRSAPRIATEPESIRSFRFTASGMKI